MFENKKCKNCGQKIRDDWDFCPYCGDETSEEFSRESDFDNIIENEFKRIDKMFKPDFFDIPKINMKMPKGGNGISIIIKSGSGMKPKIEVNTSGGYKEIEPDIKKNLGIKPSIEVERPIKVSKITEEPETEIKAAKNKKIIQIRLPGIKNFKDIDVKKLEQSLEIKAFAKDKTYFKLIPISSNSEVVNKEFKNNVLKIEVE
jgi:RNA polymerase subunit RPABC4/transcription elongation factor Spt4